MKNKTKEELENDERILKEQLKRVKEILKKEENRRVILRVIGDRYSYRSKEILKEHDFKWNHYTKSWDRILQSEVEAKAYFNPVIKKNKLTHCIVHYY